MSWVMLSQRQSQRDLRAEVGDAEKETERARETQETQLDDAR